MATPFQERSPCQTASYPRVRRGFTGKACCSALSSWRLTTSGSAFANQARRLSSRLLMLLMLKVATFSRFLSFPWTWPILSPQLLRGPRCCRVLCDRAGMLTFPFSELSAKNLLVSYRLLRPRSYHATMPGGLKRYQEARCLHFVTFSCHARGPRLASRHARDLFEKTFEDTRQWYGFYIAGYVVMPEHVHLLLTEPERTKLSIALQMLKQNVARRLRGPESGPLWQPRYYDFNVWSYAKQTEKLRYIHRNPVRRGLVQSPESGRGAVSGTTSQAPRALGRSSRTGPLASGSAWEFRLLT